MIQYYTDIKNKIQESDLVVVGLGEEWNISPKAQESETYKRVMDDLKEHMEYQWILPYLYEKLTDDTLRKAYENLFQILTDKNYFVVATTVNASFLSYVKNNRVVMPCGNAKYMNTVEFTDTSKYPEFISSLEEYIDGKISISEIKFVRDEQDKIITFNTIYAPEYKEEGYLPQWSQYMSWLQGTMNRKTCLLELGAGLTFPSVFRFPFEKMAYFNQKATCFRVHKHLYHLTDEMAERSISVPMHAVEVFATE